MAINLEQFVQQLTNSGLLSTAEVSAFQQSLPPQRRPEDAEGLARELVEAHKLTRYQVSAVTQGKARSLVFDEYVILDKLGQGGMGVVLKAEHRRMKRLVAIKIIAPASMKSPEAVRRFYREVEAAARLSHPNIVAAHDAREYHGSHCLVMEYVEGRDLAAIVKDHGPLPVRQAIECILQAARGLEFAHRRGVVHRDIKPANLLLDREGTVKILDMGLARVAGLGDEPDGERLTQSGQVMGTCDYMAPEQSLDTHKADHRADIYSLGCTLYRLVTGNTPFQGETYARLFMAHLNDPIPSLCAARPDVPPQLDAVLQRMMAKQPEDRYQSMTDVIADLERCLGSRRAQADNEESLSNGALAFLREFTEGGSATRQQAPPHTDRTLSHVGQVERGTTSSLAAQRNRRKWLLVSLGLAATVLFACSVVVIINHGGGRKTTLEVPDGSQVTVEVTGDRGQGTGDRGQGTGKEPATPRFTPPTGGFDPKLATSSPLAREAGEGPGVRARSPFLGPDDNWRLPPGAPPPAIAPFDAAKAKEHQAAWAKYLGVPVEMTNSIGMKFVLIPPGEFTMGSTPEEIAWVVERAKDKLPPTFADTVARESPQCRVRISRPFYLGAYEVTQAQYQQMMGVNPSAFMATSKDLVHASMVAGRDTREHPVETVSWDDAVEFCRRLSAVPDERQSVREYLLPNEPRWEYACRAGTTGMWFFTPAGDARTIAELEQYAWTDGSDTTQPVGRKKPNPWGLYDVLGNVTEWLADRSGDRRPTGSILVDPFVPPKSVHRGLRGGSFSERFFYCRSAGYRFCTSSCSGTCHYGFRVVCEVPIKAADAKTRADSHPGQPPVRSPFLGPDDNWRLAPGAPPPAIAPFDAAKAKEHQAAWAKYLGVPVETTNAIGMAFMLIPPGEFLMGSTPEEVAWAEKALHNPDGTSTKEAGRVASEQPRHRVRISRAFYFGKFEVTQAQYQRVTGVNPSAHAATGIRRKLVGDQDTRQWPVDSVPHGEALEFCARLATLTKDVASGGRYTLPTEAQWEYACRAGTAGPWCFLGESTPDYAAPLKTLDEYAWFVDNAQYRSHPVGQKRGNAWGLHDVSGNVWEWCSDWDSSLYYRSSPVVDPPGPEQETFRIARGGSFGNAAPMSRSAWRGNGKPELRFPAFGMRLVWEIDLSRITASGDRTSGNAKPPSAPPQASKP
jgi:formylglycine-generating enzyme required for sulfatase activity/serine/threonine protein kinase